ncbi:MAG: WecB/TagA/CpsF family glycosyltransferase [Patescibacteria group bacterium]
MQRIFYHGVAVDCGSRQEQVHLLHGFLQTAHPKTVMTVNPEYVVLAQQQPRLQELSRLTDASLIDGVGLQWAVQRKTPVAERYPGADIVLALCAQAVQRNLPVGIVVPAQGLSSPNQVIAAMQKKFPGIQVLCWMVNTPECIQQIRTSDTQLLFIALGQPLQEEWMLANKKHLPSIKLMIGVGGAIDFLTGARHRAPRFLRSLGLEWGWRLVTQPKRFPRIWRATVQFWLLRFQK